LIRNNFIFNTYYCYTSADFSSCLS